MGEALQSGVIMIRIEICEPKALAPSTHYCLSSTRSSQRCQQQQRRQIFLLHHSLHFGVGAVMACIFFSVPSAVPSSRSTAESGWWGATWRADGSLTHHQGTGSGVRIEDDNAAAIMGSSIYHGPLAIAMIIISIIATAVTAARDKWRGLEA